MKKIYNILKNNWEIIIVVILLIGIIIYGVIIPKYNDKTNEIVYEKDRVLLIGDNLIENYNINEYTNLFDFEKISFNEAETSSILSIIKDKEQIEDDKVIIYIGAYDIIMGNAENTISNIKEMVSILEGIKTVKKIYIIPILNTNYDKGNKYIKRINNEKINNMNDKLKELCNDMASTTCIDIDKLIQDGQLSENITDDGFNLNNEGYKLLTNIIIKSLD